MSLDISDILIPCLSSIVIAAVLFIIFYCFKSSHAKSYEEYKNNRHLSNIKKKTKKKINFIKISKTIDDSENLIDEKHSENRHIEIKSNPEIIDNNDDNHDEIVINHPLTEPGKSILRKTDEEILINEDCAESVWKRIPLDEVEILRSRHSSVVSEFRVELKEEDNSKLSRGQKKRLRNKLKTMDLKQNGNKIDNQINNNSVIDYQNGIDEIEVDCSNNKVNKTSRKRVRKTLKTGSLTSTDSSQISEKIQSFSYVDNDEKLSNIDLSDELPTVSLENTIDKNTNNFNFNSFVNDYNNEDKIKLEREIKELKEERYNLLRKLNEFSQMATNINALKKENELYSKKCDDLERTCNALKKELTSIIQKNASTESQFVRYKSEKNQQLAFYENEMSKLTNKVSMLENDNRTKILEEENLKNNIDKLHHLVSEKDKHIQNQISEVSSIKEQLHKKRIECQELELQMMNLSSNYNTLENQTRQAYEDTQNLNAQIEMTRKDKNNFQRELEQFKKQTKDRDREQNTIMSSLQYQLDEFRREKQQSLLVYQEIEDEKMLKKKTKNSLNDIIIPEGFQLIESSTFNKLINESKEKLEEKFDNNNNVINKLKENEKTLRDENRILNDKYSRLNSEFESHLNEIVVLRQCIENLQQELSKNSDTTLEDIKLQLDEKSDALRKTEDILVKLESSVDEEKNKWRDSINGTLQEKIKLENELKSQGNLVSNQNKKIIELTTLLQSYNHSQNESIFNGASTVDFSETSSQ